MCTGLSLLISLFAMEISAGKWYLFFTYSLLFTYLHELDCMKQKVGQVV